MSLLYNITLRDGRRLGFYAIIRKHKINKSRVKARFFNKVGIPMAEQSSTSDLPAKADSNSSSAGKAGFEPVGIESMSGKKGKAATSFSFFNFLLLMLVMLALAGVSFVALQLHYLSSDLLKASTYQLDLQTQAQSNERLNATLLDAQESLGANQQNIELLSAELKQLKEQIAGISGVNRVDWLVDELQHLTRLAHQRLVLSHDADGAIALLKAADQVVVEMRQTEALPIRQAIAADILDLRVAANVDLEGAYIILDSLSKKLEELNYKQPEYPDQSLLFYNEEESENFELEDDFGFDAKLNHIVEKLQPYLYRSFRIDGDVKPMASGEERDYLSRNIQLAIEQAQLALLRREAESYRLSLEQSEKWVKENYDNSDPLTTAVLSQIEELKSYRLNPDMPEIKRSLEAVDVFTQHWQNEKVNKPMLKRSLAQ